VSGVALYEVTGLPEGPLDAASQFHAQILPQVRRALVDCDCLTLRFEPAGHAHEAWRLAAVQELARECSPGRVNGIVGSDPQKSREVADWLADQPGITGQILTIDGKTGGKD
jgi:hypothetical protein